MIACSSKEPEFEAVAGEERGWENRAISLSQAQALLGWVWSGNLTLCHLALGYFWKARGSLRCSSLVHRDVAELVLVSSYKMEKKKKTKKTCELGLLMKWDIEEMLVIWVPTMAACWLKEEAGNQ